MRLRNKLLNSASKSSPSKQLQWVSSLGGVLIF